MDKTASDILEGNSEVSLNGKKTGAKEEEMGKYKAPTFLEIGTTARPLGHSLLVRHEPGNSKKPKIAPQLKSPLFDRLARFLPELAESNEKVKAEIEENPFLASHKYDIECAEDDDEVIEMNVSFVPLENKEDEEKLAAVEETLIRNANKATTFNHSNPLKTTQEQRNQTRKNGKPLVEEFADNHTKSTPK